MKADEEKRRELEFWRLYARVYFHMEDTKFYLDLLNDMLHFTCPKKNEIWLDVGCGPAILSQLVWEKSEQSLKEIIGIDLILGPARKTLNEINNSIPLILESHDLREDLPFPDSSFDGIVSNLCLTYIYKAKVNQFHQVMREVHRVLKPGAQIVWSTPKPRPFFFRNFLAGLPEMISIRNQIKHRTFGFWAGFQILKYGLGIARKGNKGLYLFLDPEEYEKILKTIGFQNFEWRRSFADQAWICKCEKVF